MNLFESEPDGFRAGFAVALAAEESAQAPLDRLDAAWCIKLTHHQTRGRYALTNACRQFDAPQPYVLTHLTRLPAYGCEGQACV
ncbi:hypothetical protein WL22_07175 [Burkholderia ubonensis]|nr:hypothetical protein WI75_32005 [Burkholderia ubonensis]KVD22697.1 hypothetical protein WI82_22890 [Burkholderia ubonensis]KVO02307.1 hypothetical protein WJ69_28275 [Burkholderia ubonensis]KVO13742.1 hypothetical protein WJ72_14590 [Burkholderia ubonensis]KVO16467.1 hypothetical protein WJ73_10995 [Burkholderia ubonensis]